MSQVQIETNITRIVEASSLLGGHGLQSSYSQIAGENLTFGSGQHRITPSHDNATGLLGDPFNDVGGMYVPEESRNSNTMTNQQQDDIFEDIVANTNPDLISVIPSRDQVAMATLYTTEVDGFFRVKQHLMEQRSRSHARSSSSDRLFANRRNRELDNDQDMYLSDKEGFAEIDSQNISEYGGENTAMILDMIDGRDRQSCMRNAQRMNRGRPNGADLFNDAHSDYNPFENHQIEYDNVFAENRSCCGANDEYDNVSASTMSFSVRGSELIRDRPLPGFLTPQKQDKPVNVSDAKARTTQSQIYGIEEQDEDLKEFESLDFDKQIDALRMQKTASVVQTNPQPFEFGPGLSKNSALLIHKDSGDASILLRNTDDQVPIYTSKQSPETALAYQFARDSDNDITGHNFSTQHSPGMMKNLSNPCHSQCMPPSVFEAEAGNTCQEAENIRIQITGKKMGDKTNDSGKENLKPRKVVIKKPKNAAKETTKAAKPRGMGTKRLNQRLFRARAAINFRMNNPAKDGDGLKFYPLAEVSEETVTKICNKTQKSKYYQNFDFFFKRSCFRVMTEFYKDRFNTFFTERVAQLKTSDQESYQTLMKAGGLMSLTRAEMDELVTEFLKWTFGADLGAIQDKSLQLHSIMILFSHRYTKNDLFLLEEPIEFDIIRDVMYKYSKKAQDKYFAYPVECFMFAAFALSTEGQMYLRNKPDNVKDTEKLAKMLKDLAQLKQLAIQSLQQFANPVSTGVAAQTQALDPNLILGTQLLSHLLKLTKGKL